MTQAAINLQIIGKSRRNSDAPTDSPNRNSRSESFTLFPELVQSSCKIIELFISTHADCNKLEDKKSTIKNYLTELNKYIPKISSEQEYDRLKKLLIQTNGHKEDIYSKLLLDVTIFKLDLRYLNSAKSFFFASESYRSILEQVLSIQKNIFESKIFGKEEIIEVLGTNFFSVEEIKLIYKKFFIHKTEGIPFIISEILDQNHIENKDIISLIYNLIQSMKTHTGQFHAKASSLASNNNILKSAGVHLSLKNNPHLKTPFEMHISCVETIIKKFYKIENGVIEKRPAQEICSLIESEIGILKELNKVRARLSSGEELTKTGSKELIDSEVSSFNDQSLVSNINMLAFYGSFGENKEENILGQMKLMQKIMNAALQVYANYPDENTSDNFEKVYGFDKVISHLLTSNKFSPIVLAKIKKYYIRSSTYFPTLSEFYIKNTDDYKSLLKNGKNLNYFKNSEKYFLTSNFLPSVDCPPFFKELLEINDKKIFLTELNYLKKLFLDKYGSEKGEDEYLNILNTLVFKHNKIRGTFFLHILAKLNDAPLVNKLFLNELVTNWRMPELKENSPLYVQEYHKYSTSNFLEIYKYFHKTIQNTIWTNRSHGTLATHNLFLALLKNKQLNKNEKDFLLDHFENILDTKDEGDMVGVVQKRTLSSGNEIRLGYDPLVENQNVSTTDHGFTGVEAYVARAELVPFFEYINTGSTTLYKNLKMFTNSARTQISSEKYNDHYPNPHNILGMKELIRYIYNHEEINLIELFKKIFPNDNDFLNNLNIALTIANSEDELASIRKKEAIDNIKNKLLHESSFFILLETKNAGRSSLIHELLSKLQNKAEPNNSIEESKLILKLFFGEEDLTAFLQLSVENSKLTNTYEKFCAFLAQSLKTTNTPAKASILCFKAMGFLLNLRDRVSNLPEGSVEKTECKLCEKRIQKMIWNSFRDKSSELKILTKSTKANAFLPKFLLIIVGCVAPLILIAFCSTGIGMLGSFLLAIALSALRFAVYCWCDYYSHSKGTEAYKNVEHNFKKLFSDTPEAESSLQKIKHFNEKKFLNSVELNKEIKTLFEDGFDQSKIDEINTETDEKIQLDKLNYSLSLIFSHYIDKDYQLECITRAVALISNCNISNTKKLHLLVILFYQIYNDDSSIFSRLKIESSFLRAKNYILPSLLAGTVQGAAGGIIAFAAPGIDALGTPFGNVLGSTALSLGQLTQILTSWVAGIYITPKINSYSHAPHGKTESFRAALGLIKKVIELLDLASEVAEDEESGEKLKKAVFAENTERLSKRIFKLIKRES